MKKVFTLTLLAALSFGAYAQKKETKDAVATPAATPKTAGALTTSEYQLQEKIFRAALKYSDGDAAKNALFSMMVQNPEMVSLKDSLAILYFNLNRNAECVLVCRDILSANENNDNILEIKAIAEQNLGLYRESLADYEKVYGKTKNISYLYEIATLQYQLKRFGECNTTVSAILNNEEATKQTISISAGQGQSQKVPMKAAAYNLRGVIAGDLKEYSAAISNYEEALKVYPDFVLAKNNLEVLKKSQPKTKTTDKATATPKKK
ncbi:tetratricopeptide repeat protein [Flexibacter flexilis]|nr:tetratricopeptide repeat protein [Flexibacter flexilis]